MIDIPCVLKLSQKRSLALLVLWGLLRLPGALPVHAEPTDVSALLAPIVDYHRDAPRTGETLEVVYFHPSDVDPFADYQDRIQRIMWDIQAFYREQMTRLGLGDQTFALNMEGDRLKIHVVRGDLRSADYEYHHESGDQVKEEVTQELAGRVDLGRSFVMVFCGLADKKEDGSYFFHSPYYGDGGSNHRWGLCYAADCDVLDTRYFTETEKKIRYEEHLGKRHKTLADFNCLYIGGVAHELGHALSLPHNGQTDTQLEELGTALMGSGNFTYRTELRGQKGSFLTLASGLRLATHPLFTGSRRGTELPGQCDLTALTFAAEEGRLVVEGALQGHPAVAGVIAYCDPEGREGYDAVTWVAPVNDGQFRIDAGEQSQGQFALRLAACHVNGAVSTFAYDYTVDERGRPQVESLNDGWWVRRAEKALIEGRAEQAVSYAQEGLPNVQGDDARAKLNHLIALQQPAAPLDPSSVTGTEVHLSDLKWKRAKVGWGKPCRDHYFFDRKNQDGLFLQLKESFYPKGLYAHAPSRYTFALGRQWKRFQAEAGLKRGTPGNGTAVFIVKGDRKELFRSKLLKPNQTVTIDVAVEGVKTLELITESGKKGNACCWSIWGDARLLRSKEEQSE